MAYRRRRARALSGFLSGETNRWALSPYHYTMVDHDKKVGRLLDRVDEIGIADNTIVMYSTDNGPDMNSWPDGAITPFRNEKNSNWEGAFQSSVAAALDRQDRGWLSAQQDRSAPRLVADVPRGGRRAGHHREAEEGTCGKQHHVPRPPRRLQAPAIPHGKKKSPRKDFMDFSDDGNLVGVRFDHWKVVFMEQRLQGTLGVWAAPLIEKGKQLLGMVVFRATGLVFSRCVPRSSLTAEVAEAAEESSRVRPAPASPTTSAVLLF